MQKPTSELNFQIIEYIMQQSQVKALLDARDKEKRTLGMEISCKFYRRSPGGSSRSAYIVDFVYEVDW
jgi:hypothetical protein